MIRAVYWALCGWFLTFALTMFFIPLVWYQNVPGVIETGPFNMHFVMDIGLIFLTSSVLTAYGLHRHDRTALVAGALWPALHAAFHIYIWIMRGLPFDVIGMANLFGIQLPAWLMLWLAFNFKLEG